MFWGDGIDTSFGLQNLGARLLRKSLCCNEAGRVPPSKMLVGFYFELVGGITKSFKLLGFRTPQNLRELLEAPQGFLGPFQVGAKQVA
jgi:hypothetical protein